MPRIERIAADMNPCESAQSAASAFYLHYYTLYAPAMRGMRVGSRWISAWTNFNSRSLLMAA